MTTPDIPINLSNLELGILDLYGAPVSTFTRTIRMGLSHYSIPHNFSEHAPHSAQVERHNPLGLVPILLHRPDAVYAPKEQIVLWESNAIRRYIDDALSLVSLSKKSSSSSSSSSSSAPLTPTIRTTSSKDLFHTSHSRSKIDQITSLTSTAAFQTLEINYIKPFMTLESNGADSSTIDVALEEIRPKVEQILALFEDFLKENKEEHNAQGGRGEHWFVGGQISWADLYVFPILADLNSLPTAGTLLSKTPLLASWLTQMENHGLAKATHKGTVADSRGK